MSNLIRKALPIYAETNYTPDHHEMARMKRVAEAKADKARAAARQKKATSFCGSVLTSLMADIERSQDAGPYGLKIVPSDVQAQEREALALATELDSQLMQMSCALACGSCIVKNTVLVSIDEADAPSLSDYAPGIIDTIQRITSDTRDQ